LDTFLKGVIFAAIAAFGGMNFFNANDIIVSGMKKTRHLIK
jgi:hypothetical protein